VFLSSGEEVGDNYSVGSARKTSLNHVRFEVFTAVTLKKAVFWDVAPCRSGVNRRFGETYRRF
jgi:hypothetical protein